MLFLQRNDFWGFTIHEHSGDRPSADSTATTEQLASPRWDRPLHLSNRTHETFCPGKFQGIL